MNIVFLSLYVCLLIYFGKLCKAMDHEEFQFGSLKDRFQQVLSNSSLVRERRTAHFDVRFPAGTTLEVAPGINFGVIAEPKYGGKWQLSYRMTFPLPDYMVDPIYQPPLDVLHGVILPPTLNGFPPPPPPPPGRRKKRDMSERISIYDKIAATFDEQGLSGHYCVLRTICELRKAPLHIGILGDMVNILFTPSFCRRADAEENELEDLTKLEEYLEAEETGRLDRDCHLKYNKCPHSPFDMLPVIKHHIVHF